MQLLNNQTLWRQGHHAECAWALARPVKLVINSIALCQFAPVCHPEAALHFHTQRDKKMKSATQH